MPVLRAIREAWPELSLAVIFGLVLYILFM